jgi:hypothetical protein
MSYISVPPQVVAYTKNYSDDSGIKYVIRYDAHSDDLSDHTITLMAYERAVYFHAEGLGWFIEHLDQLKRQLEAK